eukprot:13518199-Heterocapsa_arctica.AAC.1
MSNNNNYDSCESSTESHELNWEGPQQACASPNKPGHTTHHHGENKLENTPISAKEWLDAPISYSPVRWNSPSHQKDLGSQHRRADIVSPVETSSSKPNPRFTIADQKAGRTTYNDATELIPSEVQNRREGEDRLFRVVIGDGDVDAEASSSNEFSYKNYLDSRSIENVTSPLRPTDHPGRSIGPLPPGRIDDRTRIRGSSTPSGISVQPNRPGYQECPYF